MASHSLLKYKRRVFLIKLVFDQAGVHGTNTRMTAIEAKLDALTLGVSNWGKERKGEIKLNFFLKLKNFGVKLDNNM